MTEEKKPTTRAPWKQPNHQDHPGSFRERFNMAITLKNVRIAFPNIFEAKAFEPGGKEDFNASFILGKKHPQVKEIEALIDEVAQEKWGAKAAAILKDMRAKDRTALHDGDSKADYDGFPGNLYISARNAVRPLVVGKNKAPVTEKDGIIYSGCNVNVQLDIWAQDNQYGKRVNAKLLGVQFHSDNDAFSGGAVADVDAFDDLTDGADADDLA